MGLKGKICLVTGASSGIGETTAAGLGALGASVVAVMRVQSPKAESAMRKIEAGARGGGGGGSVSVLYADLSSQSSIRQLAQDFEEVRQARRSGQQRGGEPGKRQTTADGIELTFAVNVLAPFLLTNLLLGRLKASAPSRIVNVSSAAAGGTVDFENLQGEKKYSTFGAYGQSKLELNMLTVELARRLQGTGVTANFLHPGVVRTNLARDMNPAVRVLASLAKPFMASPEKGARTSIYVASAPQLAGVSGKYFSGAGRLRLPRSRTMRRRRSGSGRSVSSSRRNRPPAEGCTNCRVATRSWRPLRDAAEEGRRRRSRWTQTDYPDEVTGCSVEANWR
jgi:NAD(P)-dependent dehydrogenase (short-subunit alcohol dehydrogenase family)